MAKSVAKKQTKKTTKTAPKKRSTAKKTVAKKEVAKPKEKKATVVVVKPKKQKVEKPMSALKAKKAKIPNFPPPAITFFDKALKGEINSSGFKDEDGNPNIEVIEKFHKDLDDHVDMWFEDEEGCNLLNDYLGLSPVEYKKTLSDPHYFEELVKSRTK